MTKDKSVKAVTMGSKHRRSNSRRKEMLLLKSRGIINKLLDFSETENRINYESSMNPEQGPNVIKGADKEWCASGVRTIRQDPSDLCIVLKRA